MGWGKISPLPFGCRVPGLSLHSLRWSFTGSGAPEPAGRPGSCCSLQISENQEPSLETNACLYHTPSTGEKQQELGSHPRFLRAASPGPHRVRDGYPGAAERNKQTNTQTPLLVPSASGGTKPCSEGPSSE